MADDIVDKGLGLVKGAVSSVESAYAAFKNLPSKLSDIGRKSRLDKVRKGAVPYTPTPAKPTFSGEKDLRVKILVPEEYLISETTITSEVSYDDEGNAFPTTTNQTTIGQEIVDLGGIIFPYTPSITYDTSAEYASIVPIHSNYQFYHYKNSRIGQISITGKFTVQNKHDAYMYLLTLHLLRSLTKMKFGNSYNRGTPPPICKLRAYGDRFLNDVPVAVSSFKTEYTENVDYFYLDKNEQLGPAMVPIMTNITLTLLPMYSRAELRSFSTDDFIAGKTKSIYGQGFL